MCETSSIVRAMALWAVAVPSLAIGGNGLYPTGSGTASSSMAGADIAISRDVSALTTNPAGLARLPGSRFDTWVSIYNNQVRHVDEYGNDEIISNPIGAIGGGGYATRLSGQNLVVGLGLFVQGGVGYTHEDLQTAFGTRDEASAIFSIIKFSSGLAWPVNDRLSLGLTADVLYAAARQKLFPELSFADQNQPQNVFFGSRVDGLSDVTVGARMGMQYRLSDHWLLAATYTLPVRFVLEGGTVTVNYEALGMGRVRYEKARIDGLELPQEAGLALAWRPSTKLLLTTEATWFDWSSSIKELRLRAEDPDGPAPVAMIDSGSKLDLRDQVVLSVGAEWNLSDRLLLRGGYAHGRNPQPARTLSPVLPLITEQDFALGGAYKVTPQWEISAGVDYQLPKSVTYTNAQLPFGQDSRVSNEAILLHFMIGRSW